MSKELSLISKDLQMIPLDEMKQWYDNFVMFSKSILKEGLDYGTLPNTSKPCLYKPGAEKLRFVYGLKTELECVDKTVTLVPPFVDYTYRASIYSRIGLLLAQCEGNCNSYESKYRYTWRSANEIDPNEYNIEELPSRKTGKKQFEFDFAINRAETTGKYGKPQEHWNFWKEAIASGKARQITQKAKNGNDLIAWQIDDEETVYRVENKEVMGLKNTIMKIAQKRAFVGAILIATGASEFFTQDLEDMMSDDGSLHIDPEPQPEPKPEPKPQPKAQPQQAPSRVPINGAIYAKLERIKDIPALIELYRENKAMVDTNPELVDAFALTRHEIEEAGKNKSNG